MRAFITSGRVERGELRLRNLRKMAEALAAWRCEVVVTIERAHATRSKPQNDYYWSVVVARIAAKWRRDPQSTHELLKAQFLPYDLAQEGKNGVLMNGLVIGGSTTKLNKLQFIDYLDAIVAWAAEKLDLYIPDPDPLWREHAAADAAAAAQAGASPEQEDDHAA